MKFTCFFIKFYFFTYKGSFIINAAVNKDSWLNIYAPFLLFHYVHILYNILYFHKSCIFTYHLPTQNSEAPKLITQHIKITN